MFNAVGGLSIADACLQPCCRRRRNSHGRKPQPHAALPQPFARRRKRATAARHCPVGADKAARPGRGGSRCRTRSARSPAASRPPAQQDHAAANLRDDPGEAGRERREREVGGGEGYLGIRRPRRRQRPVDLGELGGRERPCPAGVMLDFGPSQTSDPTSSVRMISVIKSLPWQPCQDPEDPLERRLSTPCRSDRRTPQRQRACRPPRPGGKPNIRRLGLSSSVAQDFCPCSSGHSATIRRSWTGTRSRGSVRRLRRVVAAMRTLEGLVRRRRPVFQEASVGQRRRHGGEGFPRARAVAAQSGTRFAVHRSPRARIANSRCGSLRRVLS